MFIAAVLKTRLVLIAAAVLNLLVLDRCRRFASQRRNRSAARLLPPHGMHARRAFFALVYGKHSDWETWGLGYLKDRASDVEHTGGLLNKKYKLSPEHAGIIRSQLSDKLRQVG